MGVWFKFLAWELEGRSPWLAMCLHLVTLCLWASALPWQRETLPSTTAAGTGRPRAMPSQCRGGDQSRSLKAKFKSSFRHR